MKWYKSVAALLAGLALWASFAPVSLWFCAPLGIALFVWTIRDSSLLSSALYGLCVGLAFFLPLFSWARIASDSAIAWVALAFAEALFIAFVGLIWQLLYRSSLLGRTWVFPWASGIVWAVCEQLRATIPFQGMPWGLLGFGQVDGPFVHLAPYGSTQLVGVAVVASGAFLTQAAAATSVPRTRRFISAGLALAIPCLSLFLPIGNDKPVGTVKVAYAQGIVPREDEEVDGSRSLTVTRNIASEVKNLEGKDFDLLVLPESTSDRDIRTDLAASEVIEEIEETVDSRPILLGTQEYVDDYRYNDYVLVTDGDVSAHYSKQHPVPFGEYLPWPSFFIAIVPSAEEISIDMRAGDEPAVLDVPLGKGKSDTEEVSSVRVAVPICFEVADSFVFSEAISEGASLIVVPTSNITFGDSAESQQQFDMTRFRAIEYGRDTIQISTVGVSGAIEANGHVIEKTGKWVSASSVVSLSLYDNLTWAALFYSHIVFIFFFLGFALTAVALVEQVKRFMMRKKGKGK